MSRPPDIDALSPAELKSLVVKLFEEAAELRRTVAALRNEIARLKGGLVGRTVKANVMRHGKGERAGPTGPQGRRRRGGTRARLRDR
jgi:uncharacterized small protein (DUF1192 family)